MSWMVALSNSVHSTMFPTLDVQTKCLKQKLKSAVKKELHCGAFKRASSLHPLAGYWVTWLWVGSTTSTQNMHIIRCVRLEAAPSRMISVWHHSTARAIREQTDPMLSNHSRGTLIYWSFCSTPHQVEHTYSILLSSAKNKPKQFILTRFSWD